MCVAAERQRLVSSALGSCVGVILHDPLKQIGGLAHIMLPCQVRTNGLHPAGKFADTAIPAMMDEMRVAGALRTRMIAKIIGGAEMFAETDGVSIGERNIFAVKALLEKAQVPIVASDTGGHHARTIEFDTGTGIVQVRSVRFGIKEI